MVFYPGSICEIRNFVQYHQIVPASQRIGDRSSRTEVKRTSNYSISNMKITNFKMKFQMKNTLKQFVRLKFWLRNIQKYFVSSKILLKFLSVKRYCHVSKYSDVVTVNCGVKVSILRFHWGDQGSIPTRSPRKKLLRK